MRHEISEQAGKVLSDLCKANSDRRLPRNIKSLLLSDLVVGQKPSVWNRLLKKHTCKEVILREALEDQELKEMIFDLIKKRNKSTVKIQS